MTARTAAGDAELVWIDSPTVGVVPHEANRPVDILLDLRDDKPWLRPVHDREHSVSPIQERLVGGRADVFVIGKEPAADHIENSAGVFLLRLEDIQRQRGAEFASINDVFRVFEMDGGLRPACECKQTQKPNEKKFFHRLRPSYFERAHSTVCIRFEKLRL